MPIFLEETLSFIFSVCGTSELKMMKIFHNKCIATEMQISQELAILDFLLCYKYVK